MIQLNLKAENDCHQAIKNYLEENVSETLAYKINNGVKVQKDGKTLVNKKTLKQFWDYASKKAQAMKTGYVANDVVFGWAIHYFEESDIIGTLYNEDGSEYKPPKVEVNPLQRVHTPIVSQKTTTPKPAQTSLFDLLTNAETDSRDLHIEETTELVNNHNDLNPTELEVNLETGEVLNTTPFIEYKPNSVYQKYLDIEKQYPHAVVAYRLGDFYEIFGDTAVIIARELDLTLTARDCGLAERVPMIGFPYHVCDKYFNRIRQRRKLVIIEEDGIQVCDKQSFEREISQSTTFKEPEDKTTIIENNADDLDNLRAQNKHIDKDALCVLLELFDYELDVQ